jgi:hypothetical protein
MYVGSASDRRNCTRVDGGCFLFAFQRTWQLSERQTKRNCDWRRRDRVELRLLSCAAGLEGADFGIAAHW